MKTRVKTLTSLESVLRAWELYASGQFEKISENPEYNDSPSEDLRDLCQLALLETTGRMADPQGSLFAELMRGMRDYKSGHMRAAAETLGTWLLQKDYHTSHVVDRFVQAAFQSEMHRLSYDVLCKFVRIPAFKERIAGELIRSAHHAGLHREAVQHYRDYATAVPDMNVHQKAALSMIHTGLEREGEKILLRLFERITGKRYAPPSDAEFDALRKRYSGIEKNVAEKKHPTQDDLMDVGLSHLFHGRYDAALHIFESLKRRAA